MANKDFLKDQVLVTKGQDPRTGQPGLVQVVFVRYFSKPSVEGDCVVRDQNNDERIVNSDNLANIMWAEEVLARRQYQARGRY